MKKTLKKQVKWRKDKNALFICDCKKLIDLKLDLKYESFLKKLDKGIDIKDLDDTEKLIFLEFESLNFLIELSIKPFLKKDFHKAMKILDNELGKKRVRNSEFLKRKFKDYKKYFIGIYLGKELVGVICGFPREDYFLISEIAVDSKFHRRGFGKQLVHEFEKRVFKKFDKINVGAEDNVLQFYSSLGYKPFLLAQFNNKKYTKKDFDSFDILSIKDYGVELKVNSCNLDELNNLRRKYKNAKLQYIFTKER